MRNARQLVWIRNDLRIQDNKALYHASKEGPVICVFLLCPGQWRKHGDGNNKLFFQVKNLEQMVKSLEKLNIPLVVHQSSVFQDCPTELLEIAKELACQGVWFNDQYGLNEQGRDQQVEQLFIQNDLTCNRFTDQLLFTPGSLLNGKGEYFKVFTPFKKHLYQRLELKDIQPLPAPAEQAKQDIDIAYYSHFTVHFTSLFQPTAKGIEENWPPGEQAAQKALHRFISERATDYKNRRDIPSLNGTSNLSPWLNAGAISIRQCFFNAWVANNGELDTGSQGLACWMSELIWREFYKHILFGFPRLSKGHAFKEETDLLPWSHDKTLYETWKMGQTGIPLVDAAMKQLVHTGWMHNRLRMVTAMFLSKNLLLDWRLGERFFMEHLVDGDLAANNGGWQWSASTGTDAAPYFRMFNPLSQSRKFDKNGNFIRQWLPQLAHFDSDAIHSPYTGGEHLGLDYPHPVVDLGKSRKRVLAAFKALKD